MKPSAIRLFVLNTTLATLLILVIVRVSGSQRPFTGRFLKNTLPVVFFSVTLNFVMLYVFTRRQKQLAVDVLGKMRKGDLKARFPVRVMDEVGQLYQLFNDMADEIERLVNRLHKAETSRTRMLRELSHDVRTPLTSVRYLIESLNERAAGVSAAELKESTETVLSELSYFQRLIEDLFLLAQIDEPAYRPSSTQVPLLTIVEEECQKLKFSGEFSSVNFIVEGDKNASVLGDAQLLRRAVRNLIQNAAGFARHEVKVSFQATKDGSELKVRDDGPGFQNGFDTRYGERRETRLLDASSNKRVSLGLGSVIVRNVTEAHRGKLTASNWSHPDGSIAGALVTLSFPS